MNTRAYRVVNAVLPVYLFYSSNTIKTICFSRYSKIRTMSERSDFGCCPKYVTFFLTACLGQLSQGRNALLSPPSPHAKTRLKSTDTPLYTIVTQRALFATVFKNNTDTCFLCTTIATYQDNQPACLWRWVCTRALIG